MFRRMTDSTADSAGPAPEAIGKFERLKALLREMFQLDRGDLDFGLYRIMNMKAAEVTAFLDDDLLPQVRSVLQSAHGDDRRAPEREVVSLADAPGARAGNPDRSSMVAEMRVRIAETGTDGDAEAEVYNRLADFFSRYYSEGDFVSQRRYSGGAATAYLIPYEGEEVKLHWANADQYYVKTTENYAAYAFSIGEGDAARRVRFEIAAADNEKDNVKETNGRQRRFVLAAGDGATTRDGGLLTARFEHRPLTEREKTRWPGNGTSQQRRVDADSCARILAAADPDWRALLAAPAPTEANGDRTLLARHVERYTAKNSFDYFIHKDLGGFLRRELDLYLAAEALNLDDVERGDAFGLGRALARVRAVRRIGGKIIDFLAQLEDFQKRLWLKKKFVLEAQWCVTLDRVPETLRPEIAANGAQCAEWKALYAVDEVDGDLANGGAAWSDPPGTDFLKRHPFLTVDTRHFSRDFADRLLAALSDAGPLDERSDGLLIHGENFQALNLLQARYRERVKCVYIDPPYNSKTTEILYKNSYKHSSWLTLMENRLEMSRNLSAYDGSHVVAIDENEQEILGRLLSNLFPDHSKICVSIVHNKKGIQGALFSYNHDYAFFCIPSTLRMTNDAVIAEDQWKYDNLRKWGRESERHTARNCFYPVIVKNDKVLGFGEVSAEDYHPESGNIKQGDNVFVYPIDSKGVERKWRYSRDSVEKILPLLRVKTVRKTGEIQIEKAKNKKVLKTVWDDPKYIAGDYGTRWLTFLGLKLDQDLYPKSLHTVADSIHAVADEESVILDYFAGSGTTGHAVVELNRLDGGNRKYLLVDFGQHFDSVLLPRMKKVVYSSDWRAGEPVSRKGVSQLFRYVRLESYEDTMDSLEIAPPPEDYLAANPELAEDYRLRYALGEETGGSACLLGKHFVDPFSYTLSVVREGVRREAPVDLPETFNFLIGLTVEARRRIDGVLAISGTDRKGRHCLVLWRDLRRTDAAALDAWFAGHRARFAEALDIVYANGDHTLGALREPEEGWTAETIEPAFRALMFDAAS